MNNRNAIRLASMGFAALASLALHQHAYAAGGSGTTTVTILPPFSLQRQADLDFGILAPGTGGTAAINAQTGVLTPVGVIPSGGTVSRGLFRGTGTPGLTVSLSINPSPAITVTNSSGPQTMTINQLRVSVDGGTPRPLGPNHVIGSTGIVTIALGGRLNVSAIQAEGAYSGTFSLTMEYQ